MKTFESVLLEIDEKGANKASLLVAADALEDEGETSLGQILRAMAEVGLWPRPAIVAGETWWGAWSRTHFGQPATVSWQVRPGVFEAMEGDVNCVLLESGYDVYGQQAGHRTIAFPTRSLAFLALIEAYNKLHRGEVTAEELRACGWGLPT